MVYQIGVAPVRVDILTEITAVEFSDAWHKKVASSFFGVPVHFISLEDLLANKRALGRDSDLTDLVKSGVHAKKARKVGGTVHFSL